MSDKQGNFLKYAGILALIAGCGALLVGGVYSVTEEKIARNEAAVKQDALTALFPEGEAFDSDQYGNEDGDKTVVVVRRGGEVIGYATVGKAQGYGGELKVLVGVKASTGEGLELAGISVLGHSETPGLGAKIEEVKSTETLWSRLFGGGEETGGGGEGEELAPWFQAQFAGRTVAEVETFADNPKGGDQEIDAITAATISSRAVASAVLDGAKRIGEAVMGKAEGRGMKDESGGGRGSEMMNAE